VIVHAFARVPRRRIAGEAGFDVAYLLRRSKRRNVRPILPLSLRALAWLVLIAGGAAVCFLTFLVAMTFLFSIFIEPPVWKQVIGYASLVGPLPVMTGATLLFFRRTEKPGAKLVLVGSALMTLYMIVCFLRLDARAMGWLPFFLIYVLAPVVVLAVDGVAVRIHKRARE